MVQSRNSYLIPSRMMNMCECFLKLEYNLMMILYPHDYSKTVFFCHNPVLQISAWTVTAWLPHSNLDWRFILYIMDHENEKDRRKCPLYCDCTIDDCFCWWVLSILAKICCLKTCLSLHETC
jgi:hypothetical protein